MSEGPLTLAPELAVHAWYNTKDPVDLLQLRGKVVVMYAFQMLCPACVSHSIPQAKSLHQYFSSDDVCVLGLHSVFEHHDVMTSQALAAFISEYRLNFPIAVDAPGATVPIPQTMQRYELQGTPSVLLIDRQGYLRVKAFGHVADLPLGHWIGRLLSTTHDASSEPPTGNALQACLVNNRFD